jgi:FkbM family methyltransferase
MMAGKVTCIVPNWCIPHCTPSVSDTHTIEFSNDTNKTRDLVLSILQELLGGSEYKERVVENYGYSIEQTWVCVYDNWNLLVSQTEDTGLTITTPVVTDQCSFRYTTLNTPTNHLKQLCQTGKVYPSITTWLSKNITPLTTFLDIGCFTGYYSMFASYFAKQVFSYEIHPFYIDMLVKNKEMAGRTNIGIHRLGFHNTHSYLPMTPLNKGEPCDSTMDYDSITEPYENTYDNSSSYSNVRCDTLDRLFSGRRDSFHHPLIVKIDVNGTERFVLEGAQAFMMEYKPLVLIRPEYVMLLPKCKVISVCDPYLVISFND